MNGLGFVFEYGRKFSKSWEERILNDMVFSLKMWTGVNDGNMQPADGKTC